MVVAKYGRCQTKIKSETTGDIGGSKSGTDWYGHEKEKLEWFGQVKRRDERENTRPVAKMMMDGGKAPLRKTQAEMEGLSF